MNSGPPFRQVRVPADLAGEVVALLRDNPFLGYRTLSDFVRSATADKLRLTHLQLGMRSLWLTSELGADAVDALLRDSLPPECRHLLEGRRSQPRQATRIGK